MARANAVRKYKTWNIVAGVVTLFFLVAVIWVDIASGFWQETVILSGVAAGLVTFLFTAFFLDGAIAKRAHRKWFPVTRVALSDLLHTIADDERSDIQRRKITARSLPTVFTPDKEGLDSLLNQVVTERDDIRDVLARWAQFLASSADVSDLMVHIADLAEHLDNIRDEVITIEERASSQDESKDITKLRRHIESYNKSTSEAIKEIIRIQDSLRED